MNCLRTDYDNQKLACQPVSSTVSAVKKVGRHKGRKGRFIKAAENLMFVTAAVGVLWVGTSTIFDSITSTFFNTPQSTTTVTVLPGETLWQIAARVGQKDEGQNEAANEIRALNPSLSRNPVLSAGQTIVVPALSNIGQMSDLHLAKANDTPNRSM